ncbi:MAG TPA: cysteine dioxygenase family protein [Thermoleophilaceae bacterium]|jgi:predicted metal-dependent enzyme (double-stranded beta helix superfamily)
MSKTVGSFIAPPQRELDRAELLMLVHDIAAHPEWWEYGLDEGGAERTYDALHRDANLDVWAIAWLPENDTGWHDHDMSSGAVRVVRGVLTESVLRIGGSEAFNHYPAGSAFTFAPTHIHRVTCEAGRAVSIHAYSPPLSRLGQYTVDDEGVLLRMTVTDSDELRPLDAQDLTLHA